MSHTATLASLRRLTYRPHERASFFLAETGEEIHSADFVAFEADGCAYI